MKTLPLGVADFSSQYSSDTAGVLRLHDPRDDPGAGLLPRHAAADRQRPAGRGEGMTAPARQPPHPRPPSPRGPDRDRDPSPPRRDRAPRPHRSTRTRVLDLLGRMTLEEKLAQLVGFWDEGRRRGRRPAAGRVRRGRAASTRRAAHGLGHLTRALRHPPGRPGRAGRVAVGVAAPAGHARPGSASPRSCTRSASPGSPPGRAATFPTPLAWGAAFDPELVEEMGAADRRLDARRSASTRASRRCSTSSATRAGAGSRSASPRTRTSSAPSARPTCAGLQSAGVHATLKHFVGYSASQAGRNFAPVHAGPRELADVLLRAVRDGGARRRRAVGHALLRRDRRRPGGGRPRPAHRAAARPVGLRRHGRRRLLRGRVPAPAAPRRRPTSARRPRWRSPPASTSSCPPATPTSSPLAAAVRDGRGRRGAGRPRGAAGAAPRRRSSGCSTRPSTTSRRSTSTSTRPSTAGSPRRLAEESVVLLTNDGILPLDAARRGGGHRPERRPRRGALRLLLLRQPRPRRSTRAPRPASTCRPCARRSPREWPGAEIACAPRAARSTTTTVSGFAGCRRGRRALPTSRWSSSATRPGCSAAAPWARAATATTSSCPACSAGSSRPCSTRARRWCSCCSPAGPTPSAGRWSAAPPWCRRSSRARRAAPAIAGVLSGRVNPSGRLPVSLPRSAGAQPYTYLHPALGGDGDVTNLSTTPALPFGHGLSYTTFRHDRPRGARQAPTVRAGAWPGCG